MNEEPERMMLAVVWSSKTSRSTYRTNRSTQMWYPSLEDRVNQAPVVAANSIAFLCGADEKFGEMGKGPSRFPKDGWRRLTESHTEVEDESFLKLLYRLVSIGRGERPKSGGLTPTMGFPPLIVAGMGILNARVGNMLAVVAE